MIEVSLPLTAAMPHWPGSCAPRCDWETRLDRGEESDASRWTLSAHQGTHVDAPSHFIPGGVGIDEVDLVRLCGAAQVVRIPGAGPVTAQHVRDLVPPGCTRVLWQTENSRRALLSRPFDPTYAGVTPAAAVELVRREVLLVGVDYLSLECFTETAFPAHRELLGAGIPILEGLDLSAVAPGRYRLTCLPLRLAGAEAAPARALLEPL